AGTLLRQTALARPHGLVRDVPSAGTGVYGRGAGGGRDRGPKGNAPDAAADQPGLWTVVLLGRARGEPGGAGADADPEPDRDGSAARGCGGARGRRRRVRGRV